MCCKVCVLECVSMQKCKQLYDVIPMIYPCYRDRIQVHSKNQLDEWVWFLVQYLNSQKAFPALV